VEGGSLRNRSDQTGEEVYIGREEKKKERTCVTAELIHYTPKEGEQEDRKGCWSETRIRTCRMSKRRIMFAEVLRRLNMRGRGGVKMDGPPVGE